eukprot:gnl/MRDRNA2_/MRDRNA2_139207_c0_seq1.p1 gnl/MRDRNA2_/MRDRNA2_139207_c0~~gnl/MRDRNA2_/MRDRNA2_139207_c0_seq1.p1  ORF type:complete len:152 (-),score=36.87 gnl/MRDRNA2_/MRDRNA2_139207_c0_seq1:69-524(-)
MAMLEGQALLDARRRMQQEIVERKHFHDVELEVIEKELSKDLASRRFWPEETPRPEGAYRGDDLVEGKQRMLLAGTANRRSVTNGPPVVPEDAARLAAPRSIGASAAASSALFHAKADLGVALRPAGTHPPPEGIARADLPNEALLEGSVA